MEDLLFALKEPIPEQQEEGVLESFLRNARRILCSGLVATTLLASVATLSVDYLEPFSGSLTELVLETESMDKQHVNIMTERLKSFLALEAGWNNEEAFRPINTDVVAFVDRVLHGSEASEWQNWLVFPEQTGSVLLDYEADCCHASISVGIDGFSYMAYGPGFYDTADRENLSDSELLAFVRKVRQYGRS